MKNWIFPMLAFLGSVLVLTADDGSNLGLGSQTPGATKSFEGAVTALGPNADDPDHTFTAISDDGIAKVFRIASLKDLDIGDRVTLQYVDGETYPQNVKTIQFHKPSDTK